MKFGKRLRAESMPEWREEYLGYKKLKIIIKTMKTGTTEEVVAARERFMETLGTELKRVEEFFLKQSAEASKRKNILVQQFIVLDLENEKNEKNDLEKDEEKG
jgi:SPX domain protein involved in polyphosphate accumulation